ncbi:MAG: hypothetical protein HND57_16455 [Planctomycetes bacterium]|nr:hypothetical protein [Planctomycetota bacterium]
MYSYNAETSTTTMSSTIGPINPQSPLRLVPTVTRPQPASTPPHRRRAESTLLSDPAASRTAAKPPISIRFSHKAARLNRLISGKVDKPVSFETQSPPSPELAPAPDSALGRVRNRVLQAYFSNSGDPAGMNAAGVELESNALDTQA